LKNGKSHFYLHHQQHHAICSAKLPELEPQTELVLEACPIMWKAGPNGKTKIYYEPKHGHHIFPPGVDNTGAVCPVCSFVYNQKKTLKIPALTWTGMSSIFFGTRSSSRSVITIVLLFPPTHKFIHRCYVLIQHFSTRRPSSSVTQSTQQCHQAGPSLHWAGKITNEWSHSVWLPTAPLWAWRYT
jgi:hypothetical protein